MKSIKIMSVIFLAVTYFIAGCSATSPAQRSSKVQMSPLVLDTKQSFFHEFTVKDDKVYLRCELAIHNNSNAPLKFKIKGDFAEDKKGGLLKENELYAYGSSDEIFQIEGNGTLENIPVNFIGDYGGTNQKQNRLLPDKIEFEVQDDK